MSRLTIYPEDNPSRADLDTTEHTTIRELLHGINVRFERWQAVQHLSENATDSDVLHAYATDVERIKQENGYRTVDVLRCNADTPNKPAVRSKFLNEHTHNEDEVRFFVEGAGVFYLRAANKVYMTLCERGDLISVPAGTHHWFDMGANPHITAIRFFDNQEGWVPRFTGSTIAAAFPKFRASSVSLSSITAILLDVEGTTSSISFVKDLLFPYARARLHSYVHANQPQVAAILDEVRTLENQPALSIDEVIAVLTGWHDADRKLAVLKKLQGMIWEAGYATQELQGHIYEDVVHALRCWQAMGIHLYIYSSGSVLAQRLLFSHTTHGDLTPLLHGYFDTTVGSKLETASYLRIAAQLNAPASRILFVSDNPAEIAAASTAGMQALCIDRAADTPTIGAVRSFQDIHICN